MRGICGDNMRITKIEDLHCNAGWRDFSFLGIGTDEGLVGWSEFMKSSGSEGLAGVIRKLGSRVIGWDPRAVEKITAYLPGVTRQSVGRDCASGDRRDRERTGGSEGQGLGHSGLRDARRSNPRPTAALLVALRYLAHQPRRAASRSGPASIRSARSRMWRRAGAEVARPGLQGPEDQYHALRGLPEPYIHMPGFNGPGSPELNINRDLVDGLVAQMTAFRDGAGPGVGLHLDLNFNFKTEGYIRLAQALEPFDLVWLEVDSYDPAALATIRRSARPRIASLESLHGRRQFRPFFEHQSVDVAIIDVAWNGILESMKIAAMADAYEVNVAPHNFNGHIGSLMSAHMCAAIPNFRVMEIDIEDVPWKDELVSPTPKIENGMFVLPTGPGWGVEVNEEVIRAHPPQPMGRWER